jgi:hypothetical protein
MRAYGVLARSDKNSDRDYTEDQPKALTGAKVQVDHGNDNEAAAIRRSSAGVFADEFGYYADDGRIIRREE